MASTRIITPSGRKTITTSDILRNLTQPSDQMHSFTRRVDQSIFQSVRRLVDVLLNERSSDLMEIAADLGVSDCLVQSAVYPQNLVQFQESLRLLERCAVLVLEKSKISWGRIVSVLALYVHICRRWSALTGEHSDDRLGLNAWIATQLAEEFGSFLDEHIQDWMSTHGGWTSLAVPPAEESVFCLAPARKDMFGNFSYLGYAVMGMGIGTLLGLMVVK